MKIKEITQKSEKDLQKDLIEIREKLRVLKFDLSAGKVKNVREIRVIKKNIAQIITIINLKNKQN